MRKNILLLSVLFFISFKISATPPSIYSFVSDPFPPYVMGEIGDRGQIKGLVPWYLSELMRTIGHGNPYVEIMPRQRCMKEVKDGKYDAIMQMRYNAERAKDYIFTVPYVTAKFKLYYLKKRFPHGIKWKNPEELSQYQILATQGYYYGETVEALEKNGKLKIFRTIFDQVILDQLLKGRGDLYLSDAYVADYHIAKAGLKNQVGVLEGDLGDSIYHIAISKNSPLAKEIDKINSTIKEMKTEEMFKKWLKEDEEREEKNRLVK